jgi:hypothetical protein
MPRYLRNFLGNEQPRRKQRGILSESGSEMRGKSRGIEPAEIPNSFAFGINSTNASNFATLVFNGCH